MFLYDTHILIWAAMSSDRLPVAARTLLADHQFVRVFSVVSIWELAIKRGRGQSDFRLDPRVLRRGLVDNGYNELSITSSHAVAVDTLPHFHKDPFDRLLVAQALVEDITLVTADPIMARYPGSVRLV